jgi:hypothetical protein
MPTNSAIQPAAEVASHLGTLRALLRLVDPASPFQPILRSSIDLVAWLALISRFSAALRRSLQSTPEHAHQFFRLADTLCEPAEVFAFPPDGYSLEESPEIPSFSRTSAMCEEDAAAIDAAIAETSSTDSAANHQPPFYTLTVSTQNLTKSLSGPGDLLGVMKQRCKMSRPFRRRHQPLIASLDDTLNRLSQTGAADWAKQRLVYAKLNYLLTQELLPRLDEILDTPPAGGKQSSRTGSAARSQKNALKKKSQHAINSFRKAYDLVRHEHDERLALQYHTLFRGLLESLASTLASNGLIAVSATTPPRIIKDIQRLPPDVIDKTLLASWDANLPETERYDTEVVLAALHYLETCPAKHGHDRNCRLTYGFSEGDMAAWIRSGDYDGADPTVELSAKNPARTKRAGRTLHRLLSMSAAFHGRHSWAPPLRRSMKSTQHRLWTVNPLLALLPRIATILATGNSTAATCDPSTPAAQRPTPSRRNKGTRPRRKT